MACPPAVVQHVPTIYVTTLGNKSYDFDIEIANLRPQPFQFTGTQRAPVRWKQEFAASSPGTYNVTIHAVNQTATFPFVIGCGGQPLGISLSEAGINTLPCPSEHYQHIPQIYVSYVGNRTFEFALDIPELKPQPFHFNGSQTPHHSWHQQFPASWPGTYEVTVHAVNRTATFQFVVGCPQQPLRITLHADAITDDGPIG